MNRESRLARRLSDDLIADKRNSRCGSRTALQEAMLKVGDAFEFARAELDVRGFDAWLSVLTCKVADENARLLLREWPR